MSDRLQQITKLGKFTNLHLIYTLHCFFQIVFRAVWSAATKHELLNLSLATGEFHGLLGHYITLASMEIRDPQSYWKIYEAYVSRTRILQEEVKLNLTPPPPPPVI